VIKPEYVDGWPALGLVSASSVSFTRWNLKLILDKFCDR